jgi:hypothetical protein
MSYDAQCEAVAPRVTGCAHELMIADLERLMEREGPDREQLAMVESIERYRSFTTGNEARNMAIVSCHADHRETFPARVVACWEEETCPSFVRCMTR